MRFRVQIRKTLSWASSAGTPGIDAVASILHSPSKPTSSTTAPGSATNGWPNGANASGVDQGFFNIIQASSSGALVFGKFKIKSLTITEHYTGGLRTTAPLLSYAAPNYIKQQYVSPNGIGIGGLGPQLPSINKLEVDRLEHNLSTATYNPAFITQVYPNVVLDETVGVRRFISGPWANSQAGNFYYSALGYSTIWDFSNFNDDVVGLWNNPKFKYNTDFQAGTLAPMMGRVFYDFIIEVNGLNTPAISANTELYMAIMVSNNFQSYVQDLSHVNAVINASPSALSWNSFYIPFRVLNAPFTAAMTFGAASNMTISPLATFPAPVAMNNANNFCRVTVTPI